MNYSELLILCIVSNAIELGVILVLCMRSSKLSRYKDAIHKIDNIIEDLEPKPPPPRDPRKGMEWKIKRQGSENETQYD